MGTTDVGMGAPLLDELLNCRKCGWCFETKSSRSKSSRDVEDDDEDDDDGDDESFEGEGHIPRLPVFCKTCQEPICVICVKEQSRPVSTGKRSKGSAATTTSCPLCGALDGFHPADRLVPSPRFCAVLERLKGEGKESNGQQTEKEPRRGMTPHRSKGTAVASSAYSTEIGTTKPRHRSPVTYKRPLEISWPLSNDPQKVQSGALVSGVKAGVKAGAKRQRCKSTRLAVVEVPDPLWNVGTRVRKHFVGYGWYNGCIVAFEENVREKQRGILVPTPYMLHYPDDGDLEHVSEDEVRRLVLAYAWWKQRGESGTTDDEAYKAPEPLWGLETRVRKFHRDHGWSNGYIRDFDSKAHDICEDCIILKPYTIQYNGLVREVITEDEAIEAVQQYKLWHERRRPMKEAFPNVETSAPMKEQQQEPLVTNSLLSVMQDSNCMDGYYPEEDKGGKQKLTVSSSIPCDMTTSVVEGPKWKYAGLFESSIVADEAQSGSNFEVSRCRVKQEIVNRADDEKVEVGDIKLPSSARLTGWRGFEQHITKPLESMPTILHVMDFFFPPPTVTKANDDQHFDTVQDSYHDVLWYRAGLDRPGFSTRVRLRNLKKIDPEHPAVSWHKNNEPWAPPDMLSLRHFVKELLRMANDTE